MSSNIVGEASVRIRPDSRGFDSELRGSVGSSLGRIAKVAGGALVAGGLVRTISQQIGAAGSLQKSLRESVGLLGQVGGEAERTFGSFSREVAALSREVGIAQEEISGGLYEALGAGVPRGNAIEFLRVSSKAATAGVTELNTAVDGITTVINAYGLKASDAAKVSDSLFQTVNAGKVTFDELASSLFNVAPIAASAGVDLQTVGAAIATLTAGGVPASVATTQLRQAIQSIIAPSKIAEKTITPVFEKAGFASGQAALKGLGLKKTLELVRDASGGSSIKLQRLVGNVEGLNAILTLTGKGAGLFSDELVNQGKAAGVTDKALAQIERSAGRSFERAKISAENFGLAIGDAAAPAVARLADDLEAGLNRISASSGFKRGVASIADDIAGAVTDPATIASVRAFGQTAGDVFGAVQASASATSPAVREVAQAFGALAASPLGPGLLLTALAYGTVGRAAGSALPRITAFAAAQKAQAATTAATIAANRAASVSAIGLVGPSTAAGAAAVRTGASLSRAAGAARGLGAGLVGLAGGPASAAILAASALAAGAFILTSRESNAEQAIRETSEAMRDQATAADVATAALERQRGALTGVINARVGIDDARGAVQGARGEFARVQAAPAGDFGGEAGKADALAAAKNRLAQAENNLNLARREGSVQARNALTAAQTEQAASGRALAAAQARIAVTGNLNRSQVQAAIATNIGRAGALNYAQALSGQARAQAAASTRLQQSATVARQSAQAVDTTTAAGKKLASQLKTEARESTTAAAAARANGIATAQRAIKIDQAIASSSRATGAEKRAATERIKAAEGLIGRLRAAGLRSGQAQANGFVAGLRSRDGQIRAQGAKGGESAAKGTESAAPLMEAGGETAGTGLGTGIVRGIDAQLPAIVAAGERAGAAGAAAVKRGAQVESPSKLTTETGKQIGRGLQVGMAAEQGKTDKSGAALAAAAIRGAARVGVVNAKTQGKLAAKAFGDGFRVTGPTIRATISTAISSALRESVLTARSNLSGFASQLADLASQAIDAAAPSFRPQESALASRSAALDSAGAVDQERQLRNAVSLAEAGREQAQKRFAALSAAAARRTPEQNARLSPLQRERERIRLEDARIAAEDPARAQRLELERFLLGQDQARLSEEQRVAAEVTEAKRTALQQQLADLAANLNAGRIKIGEFNAGVAATLAANGVNIAAVGAQLGTAYVDAFNLALGQTRAQAGAVGRAPKLPKGFIPGIENPQQAAIAEAITTRNVLRSSFASELERVRQSQAAQRQKLEETFRKESSAGGTRIVASEQRQLTARAKEHTESLKELRALQRAFTNAPPQTVVESIVVAAPGVDPQVLGDSIARALTNRTARAARR
jgi:TP901 family phage tail tape measure protein